MTKEQEYAVLIAIRDAMWFLLNSGNAINIISLTRILKPLEDVIIEYSHLPGLRKSL